MSSCHDAHVAAAGGNKDTGNNSSSESHSHTHSHEIEDPTGDSLYQYIDTSKLRVLNADEMTIEAPFKPHVMRHNRDTFLESFPDDAEMILFIPFTESVALKSICISGGGDGNAAQHPKNIKLFANREDIDFQNATELPALQTIELAQDPNAEIDYPLTQRKFQGVGNLTIFFQDAFDEDQNTRVYYIGFKGESKKWKHTVVEAVYESRAQMSDHTVPSSQHGNLA